MTLLGPNFPTGTPQDRAESPSQCPPLGGATAGLPPGRSEPAQCHPTCLPPQAGPGRPPPPTLTSPQGRGRPTTAGPGPPQSLALFFPANRNKQTILCPTAQHGLEEEQAPVLERSQPQGRRVPEKHDRGGWPSKLAAQSPTGYRGLVPSLGRSPQAGMKIPPGTSSWHPAAPWQQAQAVCLSAPRIHTQLRTVACRSTGSRKPRIWGSGIIRYSSEAKT